MHGAISQHHVGIADANRLRLVVFSAPGPFQLALGRPGAVRRTKRPFGPIVADILKQNQLVVRSVRSQTAIRVLRELRLIAPARQDDLRGGFRIGHGPPLEFGPRGPGSLFWWRQRRVGRQPQIAVGETGQRGRFARATCRIGLHTVPARIAAFIEHPATIVQWLKPRQRLQATGEQMVLHTYQARRATAPHRAGTIVRRLKTVNFLLDLDTRRQRLLSGRSCYCHHQRENPAGSLPHGSGLRKERFGSFNVRRAEARCPHQATRRFDASHQPDFRPPRRPALSTMHSCETAAPRSSERGKHAFPSTRR